MPSRANVTVDGKTVPDAYLRRIALSANERVFLIKRDGKWVDVSWREAHETVTAVFHSLQKHGIAAGDRVCVMSQSRPEWLLCDLAIQCLGAVTVPIYHSSSPEDVGFILEHCGAKLVFVEDAGALAKLSEAMRQSGKLIPIVGYNSNLPAPAGTKVIPFAEFATPVNDPAVDEALRKSVATLTPDQLASIVYTSGTTGQPKGAELSQGNFASELRGAVQEFDLGSSDSTVTFLPFAHIFGRVESYMPIYSGLALGFAESINAVAENIREIKPTLLVSVPRIYEKIYAKIQSEVESSPQLRKSIFYWAVGVGRQVARLRSQKAPIPLPLLAKYKVADRLVFTKIRAKMGGNLKLTVSGGAPLSPELCELFHACGIKIMEGYGLTETTAAVCANRPDDFVFGSVGKPMPGAEIRIAADGEIQLRGPMVFKRYYANPQATAEVFTPDGFFCTGDIGEIDGRGFLRITDRKKELIVTSGGKNIAPQKLENMLKGSRFISNGMVYGDKQKYLVALVCLNEPEVRNWAKAEGLSLPPTCEELAKDVRVIQLIDGEMRTINKPLASYESIKKFTLLPKDFTVETGELTPSLKLKRKVCTQRFDSEIRSMY